MTLLDFWLRPVWPTVYRETEEGAVVIAKRPSGLSKFPTSILVLPLGQLLDTIFCQIRVCFSEAVKKWEVREKKNLHQQLQNPPAAAWAQRVRALNKGLGETGRQMLTHPLSSCEPGVWGLLQRSSVSTSLGRKCNSILPVTDHFTRLMEMSPPWVCVLWSPGSFPALTQEETQLKSKIRTLSRTLSLSPRVRPDSLCTVLFSLFWLQSTRHQGLLPAWWIRFSSPSCVSTISSQRV